jgi:hypothetical protein
LLGVCDVLQRAGVAVQGIDERGAGVLVALVGHAEIAALDADEGVARIDVQCAAVAARAALDGEDVGALRVALFRVGRPLEAGSRRGTRRVRTRGTRRAMPT